MSQHALPVPNPPQPSIAADRPPVPARPPVTKTDMFLFLARLISAGAAVPLLIEFIETASGRQLILTFLRGDSLAVDRYASAFRLPRPWLSDYTVDAGKARLYQSYYRSTHDGAPVEVPTFGAWHVTVGCRVNVGDDPTAARRDRTGRAVVPAAPRVPEVIA
jgi:hypothetical protein